MICPKCDSASIKKVGEVGWKCDDCSYDSLKHFYATQNRSISTDILKPSGSSTSYSPREHVEKDVVPVKSQSTSHGHMVIGYMTLGFLILLVVVMFSIFSTGDSKEEKSLSEAPVSYTPSPKVENKVQAPSKTETEPSPEDLLYIGAVAKNIGDMIPTMESFSKEMNAPDLLSRDWNIRVALTLSAIEGSKKELRLLNAPARFKAMEKELFLGLDELDRMKTNFVYAVDNLDAAKLQLAGTNIRSFNRHLDNATILLKEAKHGVVY
jgi:hypothetical protein